MKAGNLLRPTRVGAFVRDGLFRVERRLAKRFSDYKKTLREQQATGKVRSLVWPLFFEHTAREADRFAARLDLYNRRQLELERGELVEFWSKTMGEHAGFIAHLLDPDERLLIEQASRMEKAFLREGFKDVRGDEVMKAPRRSSTSRPSAKRASTRARSSPSSRRGSLPTCAARR